MKVMAASDTNYNNQPMVNESQNENIQQANNTNPIDDKMRDSLAASDIVKQIYATQNGSNPTISEKALQAAIDKANQAIIGARREFKYSVNEKTNDIMVKVVDPDTGDVIREIPPEKIIDLVAKLQELAGVFVDEKR